jgi:apolipoprotein D and lipocalin family protein
MHQSDASGTEMAGLGMDRVMRLTRGASAAALLLLAACAGQPPQKSAPALAANVDSHRMSGQWFLIAHVPTAEEADRIDSSIELVERQDGGFDELYHYFDPGSMQALVLPRSRYEPVPGSANSLWISRSRALGSQMQLAVVYIDPDYRYAIVGDSGRGLGWIYARQPELDSGTYGRLVARLGGAGYNVAGLHRLPHSRVQVGWPQFAPSRDGASGVAAP